MAACRGLPAWGGEDLEGRLRPSGGEGREVLGWSPPGFCRREGLSGAVFMQGQPRCFSAQALFSHGKTPCPLAPH